MRSVVFTTLIALLLLAASASAQNEITLIGPHHYSDVNPVDLTPWTGDWHDYDTLNPPTPIALAVGDEIAFGMDNGTQELWIKRLVLRITYDDRGGAGGLKLSGLGTGWVYGKEKQPGREILITEEPSGTDGIVILVITVLYDPQPEWEWVKVQATGAGADILEVDMITTCYRKGLGEAVPSLTQWGLVGLVVLMLAAGAMVIARRRRATARV